MASTKSPLLEVPDDIVHGICLALLPDIFPPYYRTFRDLDEGQKAFNNLLNLACTCKVMHHIPYLFLRKYRNQHHLKPDLVGYVRTILADPKVAQRETRFDKSFWNPYDSDAIYKDDIAMLDAAKEQLTLRGLPFGRSGHRYLAEDLTIVAIANIPHLTSISVHTKDRNYRIYDYRNSLDLPHLKHAKLRITHAEQDCGTAAVFSRYIYGAPNLEVLEIEGARDCSLACRLPRVRSVILSSTCLSTYGIKNLLGVSDKLREFVYRSAHYGSYLVQTKSTHTLENLEIDLRQEVKDEGIALFISQHSFVALWAPASDYRHNLKTGQTSPARSPERLTSLLPDCIEFFQLSDITVDFLPCILRLAKQIRDRKQFPKLKKVHLRPSPWMLRQLKHGLGHKNDARLGYKKHGKASCSKSVDVLELCAAIEEIFEAGVQILFPHEVLPLPTNDHQSLQRQQDLSHCCPKCHVDVTRCPLPVRFWRGTRIGKIGELDDFSGIDEDSDD
ncbi:hypothetical protein GGR53DRAFT_466883 [Hypoxylon sp. FL1150]|nr:hypothetical protein GGR53DRAFT_466883 [Hypoxylon sp. FL1150]